MIKAERSPNIRDIAIPEPTVSREGVSSVFTTSEVMLAKDMQVWERLRSRFAHNAAHHNQWLEQLASLRIVAPYEFRRYAPGLQESEKASALIRKLAEARDWNSLAGSAAMAHMALPDGGDIVGNDVKMRLLRHLDDRRGAAVHAPGVLYFAELYAGLRLLIPHGEWATRLPHLDEQGVSEELATLKVENILQYLDTAVNMRITYPHMPHIYMPTPEDWKTIKRTLRERSYFGLPKRPSMVDSTSNAQIQKIARYFKSLADATILAADEIRIPPEGGLEIINHPAPDFTDHIPLPMTRRFHP